MQAAHGDLALVREGAREFALRAGQDHAGLGVDEELGDRRAREELGVFVHDGVDVGRFALDGDFARPGQRRAARFAGLCVGRVVDGLLRRRQFALDAGGQDALDKDVFLQDDFLAGGERMAWKILRAASGQPCQVTGQTSASI